VKKALHVRQDVGDTAAVVGEPDWACRAEGDPRVDEVRFVVGQSRNVRGQADQAETSEGTSSSTSRMEDTGAAGQA
jgi:hypothetical protein